MAVSDWSTNPALNTSIGGINIAEGCPPGNLNNADREMMAQLKAKFDSVDASLSGLGLSPQLAAFGALPFAANRLPYATGPSSFALTNLTAFGRTLLGQNGASETLALLGGIRLVEAVLVANPGRLRLDVGGTTFMFQWGSGTLSGNTLGNISFSPAFTTWARCLAVGGHPGDTANEAGVNSYGTATTTGQSILNSSDQTGTYSWLAWGV